MSDLSQLRNIGISAHIDAGKTTLSERILFYTGRIHKVSEVRGKDGAGATMDHMELEKEKGITIQSAATHVNWKGMPINVIDTPGHVDFTVEVERALRVLDGAILVLDSVAGVQSQTLTVDRQMRRYNVPRVAFVNKCDRVGADPIRVCNDIREKLHLNSVMVELPIGLEDKLEGVIDLIRNRAVYFDGDGGQDVRYEEIPDELKDQAEEYRNNLIEALGDLDDEMAMAFLEGEEISEEEIIRVLRREVIACNIVPVHLGSAYKNKGVQVLLDNVIALMPSPVDIENEALDIDNDEAPVQLDSTDTDKPLVMLAFKLEDGRYGQLTYCRIYQGKLQKGDTIVNSTTNKKVKAGRLVRMHSNSMEDIESAEAGDIVALFGVDCASGDTFTDGTVNYSMSSIFVPEPVITFAIEPKKKEGLQNFSKALSRFNREDPTFRVSRDEESGQTIIGGMGELHLEVYIERIRREYGVEVLVGAPQVAYRESITQRAEFDYTHRRQTGGSGQYARLAGYFEPAEEHYEFINEIVGGAIPKEFQASCDKGFQDSMEKGNLIGFPITGIRACINDGQSHAVDSSDMAFRIAARAAFRETYSSAKPVILEPVMRVEVETPEEFQGNVIGGLNKRRGIIVQSDTRYGSTNILADVPLSEMFGYSNDLRSSTQGKAEFSMEFAKYQQVPSNVQEELVADYQKKRAEENA